MFKLIAFLFLFTPAICFSQSKPDALTVEKIMRDPQWIGTSPSDPFWSADGNKLFFKWNPEKALADSLYYITLTNRKPVKATVREKQNVVSANSTIYNLKRTAFVYEKEGDIFYKEKTSPQPIYITQTEETEFNPVFSFDEKQIVFTREQNLFSWNISTGEIKQLTNFQSGKENEKGDKLSEEDKWLKKEQLKYLKVLRERTEKKRQAEVYDSLAAKKGLKKIYLNGKSVSRLSISPDGNFITYILYKSAGKRNGTIVPNYITESGYTTSIPEREKVGQPQGTSQFFVYDRINDTITEIKTGGLNGIKDIPEFVKDYPKAFEKKKKEEALRSVNFVSSNWSPNSKNLVVDIRSQDHKDRWLMHLDPETTKIKLLDRQHNDAWIGGPGLWNVGWIDENNFWYQSEETGFSHLYSVNVQTGKKKVYTSGKYEVINAQLSADKKFFFTTTNKPEPAQHQFFRLGITDSKTEKITNMEGGNEVVVSPDEQNIAILYSYSNKPWELYLQKNKPGTQAEQITNMAESKEFKSYSWRDPEIIIFAARDGALVHGRIYKPANPDVHKPAVIFVHGAGYLQNVNKWWGHYFREFMFHNLLADKGYYVMEVDYRGSAGYGRDWRTGIYRHMGGKDLIDNIDAADYLVKNFGVNPQRIGIYGGSYGGFITLMAMFTTPDVFAAGAGLRSVTDWANYNNGYTSNILNEPYNDSLAYVKSSPIYYAEGLKGHLLMCHGMVDRNVHFQDIVKLTQRLIELKKDHWELAVYPMENHDFEDAASWTDEYKRIFNLFENVLKK